MAEFQEELSSARDDVFFNALKDIWNEGAKAAEAEQGVYTADEFYRQLDGLRYEEVVTLTDPTGDTAKVRYRNAAQSRARATQPIEHPRTDASATYWTLFGGGGEGRPRGSPMY